MRDMLIKSIIFKIIFLEIDRNIQELRGIQLEVHKLMEHILEK